MDLGFFIDYSDDSRPISRSDSEDEIALEVGSEVEREVSLEKVFRSNDGRETCQKRFIGLGGVQSQVRNFCPKIDKCTQAESTPQG